MCSKYQKITPKLLTIKHKFKLAKQIQWPLNQTKIRNETFGRNTTTNQLVSLTNNQLTKNQQTKSNHTYTHKKNCFYLMQIDV